MTLAFSALQWLAILSTLGFASVVFGMVGFGTALSEDKILFRQQLLFEQDQLIVESQRPARLPLDLQQEMHVRSDQLGVALRRWIRELGERARARDNTSPTTTALPG